MIYTYGIDAAAAAVLLVVVDEAVHPVEAGMVPASHAMANALTGTMSKWKEVPCLKCSVIAATAPGVGPVNARPGRGGYHS